MPRPDKDQKKLGRPGGCDRSVGPTSSTDLGDFSILPYRVEKDEVNLRCYSPRPTEAVCTILCAQGQSELDLGAVTSYPLDAKGLPRPPVRTYSPRLTRSAIVPEPARAAVCRQAKTLQRVF